MEDEALPFDGDLQEFDVLVPEVVVEDERLPTFEGHNVPVAGVHFVHPETFF